MAHLAEILTKTENIVFIASEFIFIGLLALNFIGIGGDSDMDMGVDVDIDADLDVDVDVNLAADLNVDGVQSAFNYPIMLMITFFFGWFGLVGIVGTSLLSSFAPALSPWKVTVVSGAVSAIICYQLASRTARGFSKVMPSIQNYGGPTKTLEGKQAKVISSAIDSSTFSRINATDENGITYNLKGKLIEGESEVSKGGIVQIVDFNPDTQTCTCRNI